MIAAAARDVWRGGGGGGEVVGCKARLGHGAGGACLDSWRAGVCAAEFDHLRLSIIVTDHPAN